MKNNDLSITDVDSFLEELLHINEQSSSSPTLDEFCDSFKLGEVVMKHSDFSIGDAVVRRWNYKVYYIIADVDNDKWEFLISEDKNSKVKHCKVCDMYSNLRYATQEEIRDGYAESF